MQIIAVLFTLLWLCAAIDMLTDCYVIHESKWQCTQQRQVSTMPDEYECSQYTYKEQE